MGLPYLPISWIVVMQKQLVFQAGSGGLPFLRVIHPMTQVVPPGFGSPNHERSRFARPTQNHERMQTLGQHGRRDRDAHVANTGRPQGHRANLSFGEEQQPLPGFSGMARIPRHQAEKEELSPIDQDRTRSRPPEFNRAWGSLYLHTQNVMA